MLRTLKPVSSARCSWVQPRCSLNLRTIMVLALAEWPKECALGTWIGTRQRPDNRPTTRRLSRFYVARGDLQLGDPAVRMIPCPEVPAPAVEWTSIRAAAKRGAARVSSFL